MPVENEKVAFESFIGPHAAGQSLLEFLTRRFTYFSKEKWIEKIETQDLFLNNQKPRGDELLRAGDKVRYMALKTHEPPVPKEIPILFEDEDLLIVHKPAHIPVHPSGRYLRNTLIHVLQKQRQHKMLFLAHRLDRETTGVCVLTKTHLAKEKVYWQFFNGEVEKTYWALGWGIPDPKSGTVDEPIGNARPDQSKIRIKQVVRGLDSKTAKTKYHTLSTLWIEAPNWSPPPWFALEKAIQKKKEKAPSSTPEYKGPWPVSLIECRPITGRTNQIRVHMAHIGCGLLGDKLYDPDEEIFSQWKDELPDFSKIPNNNNGLSHTHLKALNLKNRLILRGHALHAKRLRIRHPRTGKMLEINAPAPKEWQGLYQLPRS
jgi:23S rRNA-/tRNA-specific pseudouridylate synthase